MTSDRPAPMVAADVDLRGYQFMPLYGDRLMASETWIAASAEGKLAALRLWWHAYAKEVPAGSLPDNDQLLANYAGYGVAVKAWKKIKAEAMRGWVLCADGRLYHSFISDLVADAWQMKQANAIRTLKGRVAATEKRVKEAKTEEEKKHVTGILEKLKESLSQALKKSVTGSYKTRQDKTGQKTLGTTPPDGGALDEPPEDPDPTPTVTADAIWGHYLDWLTGKGIHPDRARNFLAAIRKGHGDQTAMQALERGIREDVMQPIPWLMRAIAGGGSGGKTMQAMQALEALKSTYGGAA